jgi:hypothetical protein
LLAMWLVLMGAMLNANRVGGGSRKAPPAYILPKIAFAMAAVIAASFLVNAYEISTHYFRGRYGLTKFFYSIVVLFYGVGLAYVTYILSRVRWQGLIMVPIAISVFLCGFYSIFEVLSWFGVMKEPFDILYNMTHGGYDTPFVLWNGTLKRNIDWETRLRSLAFEPPALGDFLGYAWPWVLAGIAASRSSAKFFYISCFVQPEHWQHQQAHYPPPRTQAQNYHPIAA